MNNSYWSSRLFGGLSLLMGLPLILWSWRLWHRPDSLNPDSLSYRVFCAYSRTWPKTKQKPSDELTDWEIRHYAAMNLVLGVVLVVIGVLAILVGVLYPDF